MKIEINNKSQVLQEAVITVDADQALKDYNKALKKVSNKVVIPGFRKGKAPLSRVEKDYEPQIVNEYYNTYIDKYYQQALEEGDFHPMTEPTPTNIDWEKGKDFVLTLTYEIEPTIELTKYEGLEVPFKPMPIDAQLDSYLEQLRQRGSTQVDVDEPVMERDIIDVTVTQGEVATQRELLVDPSLGDDLYNGLLEKKIGDEFETKMKARLIDKDAENGEEEVEVKISVDAVRRVKLPEIDDEFAKDYEYENLEDMKAKLAEELKVDNDKTNRETGRSNILVKISEENEFEVPKVMVDNYAYHMAKPYIDAYNMEAEKILPMFQPEAQREVKHYFVLKTLKDMIEVDYDDAFKAEMIERFALEAKKTIDEYKETQKSFIESDDFEDVLKTEKLYRWLEEKNTFVEPVVEEPKQDEEPETAPEA